MKGGRDERLLVRGRLQTGWGAPFEGGLLVRSGRVAWVGREPFPDADRVLAAGPQELIAPGLIDLQVNGFEGHDVGAGLAAIAAIADRLPRRGVTGFLPTLVSQPLDRLEEFIAETAEVAGSRASGARVLGAHVEGPFINPSCRGAHDPRFVIAPTAERIERLLRRPPRMLTLAPEMPGALDAVARLSQAGVVVAAGHSAAGLEDAQAAIEAGVRFGTHLFNAMVPLHHRRPGVAGALLADSRVTVGLVADGEHLHPATLAMVVRLKSAHRVALTTDQTAAAGSPPGRYFLSGREVISDGRTVRLADGNLAGSTASLPDLLRNARLAGVPLPAVLAMATAVPARVLGEARLGSLRPGSAADLVILDAGLEPRLTLVGGQVAYERESIPV